MDKWLNDFNGFMQQFWGIDSRDAGVASHQISRYRDLDPKEAALIFGDDFDLDRID